MEGIGRFWYHGFCKINCRGTSDPQLVFIELSTKHTWYFCCILLLLLLKTLIRLAEKLFQKKTGWFFTYSIIIVVYLQVANYQLKYSFFYSLVRKSLVQLWPWIYWKQGQLNHYFKWDLLSISIEWHCFSSKESSNFDLLEKSNCSRPVPLQFFYLLNTLALTTEIWT